MPVVLGFMAITVEVLLLPLWRDPSTVSLKCFYASTLWQWAFTVKTLHRFLVIPFLSDAQGGSSKLLVCEVWVFYALSV